MRQSEYGLDQAPSTRGHSVLVVTQFIGSLQQVTSPLDIFYVNIINNTPVPDLWH